MVFPATAQIQRNITGCGQKDRHSIMEVYVIPRTFRETSCGIWQIFVH